MDKINAQKIAVDLTSAILSSDPSYVLHGAAMSSEAVQITEFIKQLTNELTKELE